MYRPRTPRIAATTSQKKLEETHGLHSPSDLPEGANSTNILISDFRLPKSTQKKFLPFSHQLVIICYSSPRKQTSLSLRRAEGFLSGSHPATSPSVLQGEAFHTGPARGCVFISQRRNLRLKDSGRRLRSAARKQPSRDLGTDGQHPGHFLTVFSICGHSSPRPPHQPCLLPKGLRPQLLI